MTGVGKQNTTPQVMNFMPLPCQFSDQDYSVNDAPTLILDPDPTVLEPELPDEPVVQSAEPDAQANRVGRLSDGVLACKYVAPNR